MRRLVANGVLELKSWPGHLEPAFKKVLAIQLEDMRSAIVREICVLIMEVVNVLEEDGVDLVRFFLPRLYPLLFVSIKVISSSGNQCIEHLVNSVHSFAVLPELIAGCSDTHAPVRKRCVESIHSLVSSLEPKEGEEEDIQDNVAEAMLKCMSDGDPAVRQATRSLFFEIQELWPSVAEQAFSRMTPSHQRAIKREMGKKGQKGGQFSYGTWNPRSPRQRRSSRVSALNSASKVLNRSDTMGSLMRSSKKSWTPPARLSASKYKTLPKNLSFGGFGGNDFPSADVDNADDDSVASKKKAMVWTVK